MADLRLGEILPVFLFFVLVVGVVIIYREEIEKMELFGKLQTTPIPAAIIGDSSLSSSPTSPRPEVPVTVLSPLVIHSTFVGNHAVRFGGGRVVDFGANDVTQDSLAHSGALHTVPSQVNNYYAQAFTEESSHMYDSSPYAGSVVFLDRVSGIKESNSDAEHFILLVSNTLKESITITDWSVVDRESGESYVFPKGVKILGSAELEYLSLPIKVRSGDVVIVSSGRSPVGDSFRVNKCSGYRSQFKEFVPSIKTSCPDPVREFLDDRTVPFSDDVCYAAIVSLPACTVPTAIPSKVTKECRDFLKNVLTEQGCVARYKDEADFFTPEWRLFLNSRRELWRNRDNVLYLLDDDGLLVATLIYD